MMQNAQLWISNGKLIEIDPSVVERRGVDSLLRDDRLVLVTVNSRGTSVHWYLANASWSSLYSVISHLRVCPSPFQLNYFVEAWATERFVSSKEAGRRIDELIGKSDVRLSRKAYIDERELDKGAMPQLLQLAYEEHAAMTEHRVDTVFHEDSNMFYLERAGENSLLSRIMGEHWTTEFAGREEVSDTDFDYEVMSYYENVLTTDAPRFDHVFASITPPGGAPIWASYLRLIVPSKFEDGRIGVSSFCQTNPFTPKLI
ncbi:MAG: hypothetical protein GY948_02220 [Alphaproteobacteria bacterium]|nr:hypothetical protein [Alphaproteobacteria bacterium]